MWTRRRQIDLFSSREGEVTRAFEQRRAMQLATRPDPEYPSTGTELVASRLAEARGRRSGALFQEIDLRTD